MSELSRETLLNIIETDHVQCGEASALARMALAAIDSEPVAEVLSNRPGNDTSTIDRALPVGTQLYRHAQTAPVVPDDIKLRELFDSWFASDCSFDRSPEASEEDNIAWRESYWYVWQRCRAAMLQAGNCRENANSSTNNCREIAETSTGTAITPAAPDKKLTDDVLDEIIAGAKTSMEQYLALSLKAEREVWRKEGPTDDERIMAIEGMRSCEWCSDQGWIVGEMGITRCACGQAGNSPVHSGLRPEQNIGSPAQSPIDHGYRPDCECSGCKAMGRICAELAGWIPVSERMPEPGILVLVYTPPQPGDYPGDVRIGFDYIDPDGDDPTYWFNHGESYEHFCCVACDGMTGPSEKAPYTHWMPLPAAPQEVPDGQR